MIDAEHLNGQKPAGPGDHTVSIQAPSTGAMWTWGFVIGGVLPAFLIWASGVRLDAALMVLCVPLSMVVFILPLEMTRARGTTLIVGASGGASFRQSYLVGPLSWNGMASDISNVRVKPADAANETESLLAFCLCDRHDIEVVCTGDDAAMVAARALNTALGVPGNPAVVTDAPSGPSRRSVRIALAEAVHNYQPPDAA